MWGKHCLGSWGPERSPRMTEFCQADCECGVWLDTCWRVVPSVSFQLLFAFSTGCFPGELWPLQFGGNSSRGKLGDKGHLHPSLKARVHVVWLLFWHDLLRPLSFLRSSCLSWTQVFQKRPKGPFNWDINSFSQRMLPQWISTAWISSNLVLRVIEWWKMNTITFFFLKFLWMSLYWKGQVASRCLAEKFQPLSHLVGRARGSADSPDSVAANLDCPQFQL